MRVSIGSAVTARHRSTRVWDRVVRAFHWTLVVTIGGATLTTWWFGRWHESLGYVALGLVTARIGWGFVGSRYARFSQFVRGPRATARYARALLAHREPRFIGHNPLGALMVLAFIVCIGGLALTGWLYRSERFWGDETVEACHVFLAWSLLALVVTHVIGVVLTSIRQRENLVLAMVDGRKAAPRADDVI